MGAAPILMRASEVKIKNPCTHAPRARQSERGLIVHDSEEEPMAFVMSGHAISDECNFGLFHAAHSFFFLPYKLFSPLDLL